MERREEMPVLKRTATVGLCVAAILGGRAGLIATDGAAGAAPSFSGARIRAHVEFLADDLLEGREAGSRGFEVAARYAATELMLAGARPGADDGTYFQHVPLRKSSVVSSGLTLKTSSGQSESLAAPADVLIAPNSRQANVELTAPIVFAGYGVTAPDLGYDDYAGIDAKGKIALIFYNAPGKFPSEMKAHYSSPEQKLKNAANHGAIAVLTIFTTEDQKRFPWERLKGYFGQPAFTTLLPDGTPVMAEPRITALGYLSVDGAKKIFAGAPLTLDDANAAAARSESKPAALAVTATMTVASKYDDASSENIVGLFEGSDPVLSKTSVVLTAHIDHIGINEKATGDKINNGAYDNATGTALLLEVARAFGAVPTRPKRSVLIVFVTGEEKGLLGSNFFAHYPVKASGQIVANVNLDMPVLMAASKDIVAFGAENSTLDTVVTRAIAAEGFTLSPDPMPEENIFVRSDQYSFVKQGIPSVYLEPGFTAVDPKTNGREVFEKFLHDDYHQPGDDLSLPMDLHAAERFAEANYLIARAIADDPVAPSWKPGNFFGKVFGK